MNQFVAPDVDARFGSNLHKIFHNIERFMERVEVVAQGQAVTDLQQSIEALTESPLRNDIQRFMKRFEVVAQSQAVTDLQRSIDALAQSSWRSGIQQGRPPTP